MSGPATSQRMAASARAWAMAMTQRPSVTGTPDEAHFGPWLAERLAAAFPPPRSRVWTFPVGPGDARHCVALLVRGAGRATVVLTGHYDTVSVADYHDLEALATDPEALAPALARELGESASTPAERRAQADLASGAFLPGRGLLDMKAGLAAGISVAERFAAGPRSGNVLFLAVPDEEAASSGARRAAPELRTIAREEALDLVAAVNLDSTADDGDGSAGRVVALGTVGKLLATAFVAGVPTHAGYPQAGVNAGVLAAAIARRVEWAGELTDPSPDLATPPSLLSLRDGKAGYDVTTPATAFAAFSVQIVTRTPAAVLDAFETLCREAVGEALEMLRGRTGAFRGAEAAIDAMPAVPVLRFEALVDRVRQRAPDALRHALMEGSAAASLPERCRRLTERLWQAGGLPGPAVVVGFGSIPYLPTRLSGAPGAARLARVAATAAQAVGDRHGTSIGCTPVFAGISDMSFLGEADEALLGVVARNMPGWTAWVGWPEQDGIAGVPIVNAGPWGRDYHTRLERLHVGYAFDVLPDLVAALVDGVLQE